MSSDIERRALEESHFNPLGVAEEIAEGDKGLAGVLGFLFTQVNAERRRMLWQEAGDVYRNIEWYKFLQLLSDRDFVILKRWRFPYKAGMKPDAEISHPEALIAANVDRKLLLVATAGINGEVEQLNGGAVYGCVQGEDLQCFRLISDMRASGGFLDDRWEFELHIEDGLFTRLAMIEESGVYPVDWRNAVQRVDLGDYSNVGDNTFESRHSFRHVSFDQSMENYRSEMAQFLTEVPPEVRSFMS